MTRRLLALFFGLALFGVGCALMLRAGIGLDPWTVLAEGLSLRTGVGVGWLVVLIAAVVLLLWIPLRQRPGIGTIANIFVIGTAMEMALGVIPAITGFLWQLLVFLAGAVVVAIASGIYIGTRLGPGPRDGLMTGLHGRFGWPIWACRLGVEGTVLVLGWILGGTVGLGTVLFAVLIGPLVDIALRIFGTRAPAPVAEPVVEGR